MIGQRGIVRRDFLRRGAAVALAMPLAIKATAFGAQDRITMGCIGMGGQGRGDMGGFMGFPQVRVLAVCDVVGEHRAAAKDMVDQHYGNKDCRAYVDFREVLARKSTYARQS
jgi:hypothetical protein